MDRGVIIRRAVRNKSGNVAVIFALCLIPMLGLLGASIDYSRASGVQANMRSAADSAALAAAKEKSSMSSGRLKNFAKKVFNGNFKYGNQVKSTKLTLTNISGGVRVSVTAKLTNTLMGNLGFGSTDIGVSSEAIVGNQAAEVALVLDNTGSMQNDMASLKDAASSFVNSFMTGSGTKVAVVPFVAAVNPGAAHITTAMIDTDANAKWNGNSFRGPRIAYMQNCTPVWGGGGSPYTGPSGSGGNEGKKSSLEKPIGSEALTKLADIAVELFGIPSAHADVTPNTAPPVTGTSFTPTDVSATGSALMPDGFTYGGNCQLGFPDKISNYDIFRRIPNAKWKGCVEARAEPYDVTDDVPDPKVPDTLFVQYLWPDEFDYMPYANNYMIDYPNDGSWPSGWNNGWDWEAPGNLFKYNGINKATIKENGPDTIGPNKSCPDEILALTNKRTDVLNKISSLSYWYNGGTIIAQGVVWGWRALSPTPPFTEGSEYGQSNKIIILMSDGANELNSNIQTGYRPSDYTAYGYLSGYGRFPSFDFQAASKYLDDRTLLACNNAKEKGITIYTILFRETSSSAQNLMQSCASDPSKAYLAANGAELKTVFTQIGSAVSTLRISK